LILPKNIQTEVSVLVFLFCRFYEGVVDSYDPIKKKHKVGDSE
jgi:hypothetical protein